MKTVGQLKCLAEDLLAAVSLYLETKMLSSSASISTFLSILIIGCSKAFYCGLECQKKAWPTHKADCRKKQSAFVSTNLTYEGHANYTLNYAVS